MKINTIETWHRILETQKLEDLSDLLADDAVFHSPVMHTPQVGKALVAQYLSAAFHLFSQYSFTYVREIVSGNEAVLEFEAEMDGLYLNGIDVITWNDEGKITDFKVMLRPLKAIHLVQEKMRAQLQDG
ncbi:MAG: nuclear transport factor 2 family protein [Gammaproteobacteria bacterium]|nr:nuclear transport factor 2 family protein [Gammaproteobacteria bacterium]